RLLPPHHEIESLFPFEDLRDRLAADRRLDNGLDVADIQAIPGAQSAVGADRQVRLAERLDEAEILDAVNALQDGDDLAGLLFVDRQGRSDDLYRVLPFHAGQSLLDVVLDVLGEVEDN